MSTQICPNCQHQNRTGAKFCAGCGQPMPAPGIQPTIVTPSPEPTMPASQPQMLQCPYCGANNQTGANTCYSCGRSLYAQAPAYTPGPVYPSSSSQNRNIIWIIVGVIAGFLIFIAAGYLLIKELNPFDDLDEIEDIISPIETAIGTIDITSLPGTLETALPDIIPTEIPLEIPEDIPLEIPTDFPVSIPGLGMELPHLSDEDEIEIGREAAAEFEKDNPISSDPGLVSRVEKIGFALLPYTPRQNLPYTFKVVDTDDVNAFALPGGFIYVTRGMLQYVENDHELAGVIGHELAHVALRHSAKLIEGLAAANAALDVLTSSSEELESIYQDNSTQLAIDAVATIVINGWGRENELDADENGTIYMAKAGYKPHRIIDLFSRMQREEGDPSDPMSSMFATHPPFKDRIDRIRQTIDEHQLGRLNTIILI